MVVLKALGVIVGLVFVALAGIVVVLAVVAFIDEWQTPPNHRRRGPE